MCISIVRLLGSSARLATLRSTPCYSRRGIFTSICGAFRSWAICCRHWTVFPVPRDVRQVGRRADAAEPFLGGTLNDRPCSLQLGWPPLVSLRLYVRPIDLFPTIRLDSPHHRTGQGVHPFGGAACLLLRLTPQPHHECLDFHRVDVKAFLPFQMT